MQNDSKAIDKLMQVIRTCAQEWGSSNVLLQVPGDWAEIGQALTERQKMRLAFTTDSMIRVSAYHLGVRQLCYEFDSQVIIAEAMERQPASI